MQIADDIRPSPLVIKVLTSLARVIPTWKLTPTPDIVDIAFRDPLVVKEVNTIVFLFFFNFAQLLLILF